MSRVIISVHGIRTRGVWQKDLVPVLAKNGFTPYPLDYGRFGAGQLLLQRERDEKVEWFHKEYQRIIDVERVGRPSIVAHSFGTYLVASLLEKFPPVRFDKVIFTGSIVRQDFPWREVLSNDQVNWFRNDYGRMDPWPRIAHVVVPGTGPSGADDFPKSHDRMISGRFEKLGHSDFFYAGHFTEYWIPFLKRVFVNEQDRKQFVDRMNLAVIHVAERLNIDKRLLRANIFTEDETGALSIPEGFHYNMEDEQELKIRIPVGDGSTGTAFAKCRTNIAVIRDQEWPQRIPDEEYKKVHRRLQWIISSPIFDPNQRGIILGIFNVDCLGVRKEEAELQILRDDLFKFCQEVGRLFRAIA